MATCTAESRSPLLLSHRTLVRNFLREERDWRVEYLKKQGHGGNEVHQKVSQKIN
jgi:hypothetical protein